MKIGIISDTHDHVPRTKAALSAFNQAGAAHILHAGDICAPFVIAEFNECQIPFTAVFGNNDGEVLVLTMIAGESGEIKKGPIEIEISGKRIALMHEPVFLEALADSGHFDLIIFGHSHERFEMRRGNTLIVNPGSCAFHGNDVSVMVCDLEDMSLETIPLD